MIKSKIYYWLKTKEHQLEARTKSMISSGKFSIDNDQKKVNTGGEEIEIATLEYKILIFFIANSLKQIEYNEILVNVWADTNKTSAESVRQLIYKLRIKIEKDPQNPIYLVKAKTSGYRFLAENPTCLPSG